MKQPVLDADEWYLAECSADSPPLACRSVRLGPFASEQECRAVLDSIRQIPRFSSSAFEIKQRPKRRDKRMRKEYPVRLSRPANQENVHLARTIDVSVSGARLDGLKVKLNPGEVLTLHCGPRNAPFQVVWIGSGATEGQAGVECLTPEMNIWDIDPPEASKEELLVREMELARNVQRRLLPQEMPPLRTLDYSGHCTQARTVGGDYYNFVPMASGEVGFVIADVSGKGIAAALLMANLQGSLEGQYSYVSSDLPGLLTSVNKHLYKHTESEKYVTAFLSCYSDQTRKLRYVNCGHNPPLLLRRGGAVERLESTATVLGLFGDWEGLAGEIEIEPGDLLTMCTDGVAEAQDENGEEFGEARLLEVLRENCHLGASSLLQKIEQAINEFQTGEQYDDLTIIVARSQPWVDGPGGKILIPIPAF
jgi:stage II sporulation SpoE-like protein/PilZ domain-containing protein